MEIREVDIEGRTWKLRFGGWDLPVGVETEAGFGWMRPWPIGLHLPALAAALQPGPSGPELDVSQFAAAVLASCWPGAASPELEDLALWWASAPDAEGPDREGWLSLGQIRVRLQPWTWGQQAAAVGAAVSTEGLDLPRWLAAQLDASVVEVEPAGTPVDQLPAGPLLAALVAVHSPPPLPSSLRKAALKAASTLGWLPRQVLAAPAPDIDQLLWLLGEEEAERSTSPGLRAATPTWSGLAAWPDAVVIQIEPEES